jgi:hypothetical protein
MRLRPAEELYHYGKIFTEGRPIRRVNSMYIKPPGARRRPDRL